MLLLWLAVRSATSTPLPVLSLFTFTFTEASNTTFIILCLEPCMLLLFSIIVKYIRQSNITLALDEPLPLRILQP